MVTFFVPFASGIRVTAKLRQLTHPEFPVGKLGMRDHQAIVRIFLSFDQHNIEIESSRPPLPRAHTPRRTLDAVQSREQRSRCESRRYCDHLIQVFPLRNSTNWISLLDFGC